jgi:hypothetical protein
MEYIGMTTNALNHLLNQLHSVDHQNIAFCLYFTHKNDRADDGLVLSIDIIEL